MEEPSGPKIPKGFKEKDNSKRLIVILEHASLETVKVESHASLRSQRPVSLARSITS